MLCESILHVLVEEGILTKTKAIEAIETWPSCSRDVAEVGPPATSRITLRRNSSRQSRRALR